MYGEKCLDISSSYSRSLYPHLSFGSSLNIFSRMNLNMSGNLSILPLKPAKICSLLLKACFPDRRWYRIQAAAHISDLSVILTSLV